MKHSLTLEINQFIFKKQFEKTIPCPDKIHTFSYVFQNYLQVIWKGLSDLPVHIDEEHKEQKRCAVPVSSLQL